MVKKIALLVLAASFFLSSTALAAGEGEGIIEGQLENGTENGSSVAEQEVMLQIYWNASEAESLTTRTDGEGRFTFEGLQTASEYSYLASLLYQDVEYFSEPVAFSANKTSQTLNIRVYDTTDDDSDIVIATAHSIIYTTEEFLDVTEYLLFVNNSDRTYVGSETVNEDGQKETLQFLLPEGATQIVPIIGLMECCVFPSDDGFIDTLAIKPGMKEISYSYLIENGDGDYSLPLRTAYPVYNYDLLVEGSGISVSADLLTTEEPMNIEGNQFSHLSGDNIPAGATLTVKITGSGGATTLLWVILAIVIVAIASVTVYYFIKKKPQTAAVESGIPENREEILSEMARLDDEFESNNIPENEYRQQRAALKNHLLRLMQEESKGKDGG